MRQSRNHRVAILQLVLCPLLALLPGCGGNRIIMNLDLDSFMTREERSFEYLGINPGGDFVERSPVESVTTPEGLKELANLESMLIDFEANLDNSAVLGEVNMSVQVDFHVAASPEPGDIWAPSARLATLDALIQGGEISELAGVFDAESFLGLFQNNDKVHIGLVLNLHHLSGVGAINGLAEITQLHLRIEAREDLL